MDIKPIINEIIEQLEKADTKQFQMLVGLDGYVDKIQRVVKAQVGEENEYFSTIADFSLHTGKAAGKSAQIELVTQETKLGGNAPIMAHALGCLGIKNYCIGNFGFPETEAVFRQIHHNSTLVSLGPPAETNALEFDDGKLILSEVSPFKPLNWEVVKKTIGLEKLTNYVAQSQIVALVDWCNLPFATGIWHGILTEILPTLSKENRHFLFDLADPSKKSKEEIAAALEVINEYSTYGQVTLGLNENEARKLYHAIEGNSNEENLKAICQVIFEHFHITNLLVHPLDCSIIVTKSGIQEVPGKLVRKPRISTGGGDNLNAGFCFGQLLGLSLEASAVLGMATSGAYVQNGASPDMEALIVYLKQWQLTSE